MRKITGFQRLLRRAGLFGAPLAAAVWLALGGSGMAHDAHVVLGLAIWMALWWMTEAVPLAATALLPLVVLPLFTSIGFGAASAPYANSIVFLFMGGFMLGLALQRCGLHRRIALAMLVTVGSGQRRLVGGFMLVTALLSMLLSNTATMMMLAPIGISVLQTCREQRAGADDDATGAFGAALILGIAYAASIGGMGTPIGTPPNLIMSGYLRTHYGIDLTMLEWMRVGVPVILLLLPLTWLWLCFGAFRLPAAGFAGGEAELRAQRARLGAASGAEKRTGAVFLLVALGWVLRPQLVAWSGLAGLDDGVIALIGALLLFVLPAKGVEGERLLDWNTARGIPWDILLLFGGGLSLAAAVTASGADAPIAQWVSGLGSVPVALIVGVLAVAIVFTGELTSNTAAATAIMPVLAGLASARGIEPLPLFMVATLAGSCGFMLPVATPPNAIAYGTGCVPLPAMLRAGFGLNLIAIAVVVGFVWFLAF
jgi:solute carrier family 13 (sodium-dependent dicarboxylate transporter), member 2/3/5